MSYFSDPYEYDHETINEVFDDNDDNLGNYRIGHYEDDEFVITYVGKGNIKVRLNDHFKDEYHDDYFTFSPEEDDEEMFIQECEDFHDNESTLKNKNHPPVPKSKKCPVCGKEGGK